jgi:cholesterol oxidase
MVYKNYNRRQFIQAGASFSAGLAASLTFSNKTIASDDFVEAIVIGSGFGGAIAALRLAQAGVRTLIIERGRRWPITPAQNTFATFDKPDGRASWLNPKTVFQNDVDVYTGVFETIQENGIIVVNGAAYGGGSHPYNAITYKPKREIFYQVFSPNIVNYDELDSVYYPRVQKMLKASPTPADVLASKYYGKTRFFMENAKKANLPSFLLDLAVDWDVIRQEISGQKVASVINGQCWWGVNSGAKNTLDKNYLLQAEKTGYVNVAILHIVTEIRKVRGEQKYQVVCTEINESGTVIRRKTFTCRYLFLAAGSLGTSKLLVKAKAKGMIPNLNNAIGKYWGTNGDNITSRTNLGSSVTGNGGTAGAAIELLKGNNPIVVESLELGINPDGVHSCLGLGIPKPFGKFQYNPSTDSVGLYWPTRLDNALVAKTERLFEVLDASLSNGLVRHRIKEGMVPEPVNGPISTGNDAAISGHPLGGAVMGKACDPYGRVYGNRGLYVVDGALIPGSTACTNPSFTIAALAERCMDNIIAKDIKG